MIFGEDQDTPPLPEVDATLQPLEALSEAMIPLLEKPPCLVAFSGGRDSSVVLAVAMAIARREGLELPIPITQRFPDAAEADESQWQELVVRHVRPPDWIRQLFTDEFDLIGPLARDYLLRHGVLYPGPVYLLPMLREARGGTLLTGLGGDEIFRKWLWARAASVLGRQVRPTPRDVLRIGAALAPPQVRAWAFRRRMPLDLPWLRADALEEVRRRFYRSLATEPLRWDEQVRCVARQRDFALAARTFGLVSHETGAAVACPFLAPRFLAALAQVGGARGFGEVGKILGTHFGSLLPSALIARPDKAHFGEVYWGPYSREFMKAWEGESVSIEFVDPHGLFEARQQTTWQTIPASVLQALWVATQTFDGANTLQPGD
jgi:hypothetical protein